LHLLTNGIPWSLESEDSCTALYLSWYSDEAWYVFIYSHLLVVFFVFREKNIWSYLRSTWHKYSSIIIYCHQYFWKKKSFWDLVFALSEN
jgi:hypothetical protein